MRKIFIFPAALVLLCRLSFAGGAEMTDLNAAKALMNNFADSASGQEARDALQQAQQKAICPVFDYRKISKKYYKPAQMGGLCYAHAAATVLTIKYDSVLKGDNIISANDIAAATRELSAEGQKYDYAYKPMYNAVGKLVTTTMQYTAGEMVETLRKYKADLKNLYDIDTDKYTPEIQKFLLIHAVIDRFLYTVLHGPESNYNNFIAQNAAQFKKRENQIFIPEESEQKLFTEYNLIADKRELDRFVYVSLLVKKEISNLYSFDGGKLKNVQQALSKRERVCTIAVPVAKIFNKAAANKNIFSLKRSDFQLRLQVMNLSSADKKSFENYYNILEKGGLSDSIKSAGKNGSDVADIFLQKLLEQEQTRYCRKNTNSAVILKDKMNIAVLKDTNTSPPALLREIRRPAAIAYTTTENRGHAVTIVGVEYTQEGKCLAILQDSNKTITKAKNMRIFDVNDGYWRVNIGELKNSVTEILY